PLRVKRILKLPSLNFQKLVRNAGAAGSALSWKYSKKNLLNAPAPTQLSDGGYTLASTDTLQEWNQQLRAGSYAEVQQSFNKIIQQKPEMADQLQVVGLHELV